MKDNADYWQKRSQEITFCTDAFIGGEYRPPLTGSRFDSIDPATNTVIARVASCGAADVDDAVDAARATFREGRWSNLALEKRKSALLRLAKLIRDHSEELALTESMDMGKPVRDALAIDVLGTAECASAALSKRETPPRAHSRRGGPQWDDHT